MTIVAMVRDDTNLTNQLDTCLYLPVEQTTVVEQQHQHQSTLNQTDWPPHRLQSTVKNVSFILIEHTNINTPRHTHTHTHISVFNIQLEIIIIIIVSNSENDILIMYIVYIYIYIVIHSISLYFSSSKHMCTISNQKRSAIEYVRNFILL